LSPYLVYLSLDRHPASDTAKNRDMRAAPTSRSSSVEPRCISLTICVLKKFASRLIGCTKFLDRPRLVARKVTLARCTSVCARYSRRSHSCLAKVKIGTGAGLSEKHSDGPTGLWCLGDSRSSTSSFNVLSQGDPAARSVIFKRNYFDSACPRLPYAPALPQRRLGSGAGRACELEVWGA